jgi:hypothetical protein
MKRKGVNDPRYIARVLGEFPKVSNDSLIQPEWIEAPQKRSIARNRKPHLGIDVACYRDDESVIMQREGNWAPVVWSAGKLSTMETTGHIVRITKQLNAEPGLNDFATMAVDADGLGAGVFDRLIELGYPAGEIRGGKTAIEPEDFVNARSEWYWTLRNRFQNGEIDIDPLQTGEGHDHRPIHGDKTTSDDLAEEDCAHFGLALPAHLCLDPDPRSVWIGARSELHHRPCLE